MVSNVDTKEDVFTWPPEKEKGQRLPKNALRLTAALAECALKPFSNLPKEGDWAKLRELLQRWKKKEEVPEWARNLLGGKVCPYDILRPISDGLEWSAGIEFELVVNESCVEEQDRALPPGEALELVKRFIEPPVKPSSARPPAKELEPHEPIRKHLKQLATKIEPGAYFEDWEWLVVGKTCAMQRLVDLESHLDREILIDGRNDSVVAKLMDEWKRRIPDSEEEFSSMITRVTSARKQLWVLSNALRPIFGLTDQSAESTLSQLADLIELLEKNRPSNRTLNSEEAAKEIIGLTQSIIEVGQELKSATIQRLDECREALRRYLREV